MIDKKLITLGRKNEDKKAKKKPGYKEQIPKIITGVCYLSTLFLENIRIHWFWEHQRSIKNSVKYLRRRFS